MDVERQCREALIGKVVVSLQHLFIYLTCLQTLLRDRKQVVLPFPGGSVCTIPGAWGFGRAMKPWIMMFHVSIFLVVFPLHHGVILVPSVARLWAPHLGSSAMHVYENDFGEPTQNPGFIRVGLH